MVTLHKHFQCINQSMIWFCVKHFSFVWSDFLSSKFDVKWPVLAGHASCVFKNKDIKKPTKSGRASDNVVGIIWPPGWNRVNWSAKIWGEGGGQSPCSYGPVNIEGLLPGLQNIAYKMQLSQLMQFLNSGPPLHEFTIGPKVLKFPFEFDFQSFLSWLDEFIRGPKVYQ